MAPKIVGKEIYLDYPSVGATENIILAAILGEGETYIRNAAREPEIIDLQNFLNKMGAHVRGAGTNNIKIIGVDKLLNVEHKVISDRIVAGTYMTAAAITGGDLELTNVELEFLNPIIYKLKEAGCNFAFGKDTLKIWAPKQIKKIDILRTLPHPGFPTDMQPQLSTLLSLARGTSIIIETVFENRYKYVDELLRMGANIKVEGRCAIITGVEKIRGATVAARDLRGGAALILAGLVAEDSTEIEDVKHIDRGYENVEEKFKSIGVDIKRVQKD